MAQPFKLIRPKHVPSLDPGFRPAVLANRAFQEDVRASGEGVPLVLGLERTNDVLSRFETTVFPADHPQAGANFMYVERLVKFLLWQQGAWKIYVGGSRDIGDAIAATYAPDGARAFDAFFMGKQVYEHPFTVVPCAADEVPPTREISQPLGRHLEGYRIGFDLGASDRKVSAVVNGEAIYSEEVIWQPRENADPNYHYHEILTALKTAASKLSRVDAIGGSSAGIYVNNRPMIASLFRGVPDERYGEIRNTFQRLQAEFNVPFEIINDGDVTALAGSMSLGVNSVLGIALGSSEAAGYVDHEGNITGWLNELAFAPVDYNPDASVDEWSYDRGCGVTYFSQQAVFRLAPKVGINIPAEMTDAEKLKFVQHRLEMGDAGAIQIWQNIGIYMGYALAHYADFYDLAHVLILGRCTSGRGGALIMEGANMVLASEFPELATRLTLHLPDEQSRRVGQSIAAASLPQIGDRVTK
ncbi:MAG: ROK family protein [Anaerolineae bacterium]|nr:ROK family protein [Anaerolineae bacterium]